MDALDADIQLIIVDPPFHGIIRRRSVDRHRFTLADVLDGSVTYQHTANTSTQVLCIRLITKTNKIKL